MFNAFASTVCYRLLVMLQPPQKYTKVHTVQDFRIFNCNQCKSATITASVKLHREQKVQVSDPEINSGQAPPAMPKDLLPG